MKISKLKTLAESTFCLYLGNDPGYDVCFCFDFEFEALAAAKKVIS